MPGAGYKKRRARWSEKAVIAKAREWSDRYGSTPSAVDWNPSDCRRAARRSAERARAWVERANRFYQGEWPWTGTVYKMFGGWNAMIEAAELPINASRHLATELAYPASIETLTSLVEQAGSVEDPQVRKALFLGVAEVAMGLAEEIPDPLD